MNYYSTRHSITRINRQISRLLVQVNGYVLYTINYGNETNQNCLFSEPLSSSFYYVVSNNVVVKHVLILIHIDHSLKSSFLIYLSYLLVINLVYQNFLCGLQVSLLRNISSYSDKVYWWDYMFNNFFILAIIISNKEQDEVIVRCFFFIIGSA